MNFLAVTYVAALPNLYAGLLWWPWAWAPAEWALNAAGVFPIDTLLALPVAVVLGLLPIYLPAAVEVATDAQVKQLAGALARLAAAWWRQMGWQPAAEENATAVRHRGRPERAGRGE